MIGVKVKDHSINIDFKAVIMSKTLKYLPHRRHKMAIISGIKKVKATKVFVVRVKSLMSVLSFY